MKKVSGVVFVISLLIIFSYLISNRAGNRPAASAINITERDMVISELKLNPSVKVVEISPENILYVGVVDDGSNKAGFAGTICRVLKEKNAGVDMVRIVRFSSVGKKQPKGVVLGEAICK